MHASPYPLILWLCDDDTEYHMLNLLQKFLNFLKQNFVPVFETILLGSSYSEKIILHVFLGYLDWIFHLFHHWEFDAVIYIQR